MNINIYDNLPSYNLSNIFYLNYIFANKVQGSFFKIQELTFRSSNLYLIENEN